MMKRNWNFSKQKTESIAVALTKCLMADKGAESKPSPIAPLESE
jgi:hypothetical protein